LVFQFFIVVLVSSFRGCEFFFPLTPVLLFLLGVVDKELGLSFFCVCFPLSFPTSPALRFALASASAAIVAVFLLSFFLI
jgi:hypothetical protein